MLQQVLANGVLMGSVYALIASGLAFIYGPVDLVNFAHGDLVMVAMYLGFVCATQLGLGLAGSILLAVPVMAAIGVVLFNILKPVLKAQRLAQALATYGLGLGLQSIAMYFMGPDFRAITGSSLEGTISFLGVNVSLPRLVAGAASLLMFGLLYLFLTRSKTGKAIQAIAQNREAAMLVGINLQAMYALSFAISASCAAVGGVLLAQFFYVFPTVGRPLLLLGFVSMVIGGFGSMPGALLGGLIVGLIQTLAGFYVSTAFKDAIVYLLFVVLMIYKPRGLFGL
jgi:branched-chain amino acid transport system permease protein